VRDKLFRKLKERPLEKGDIPKRKRRFILDLPGRLTTFSERCSVPPSRERVGLLRRLTSNEKALFFRSDPLMKVNPSVLVIDNVSTPQKEGIALLGISFKRGENLTVLPPPLTGNPSRRTFSLGVLRGRDTGGCLLLRVRW